MKMINLAVPRRNLKFGKIIYIEEDYHLVMMKVLAQVNLTLEIMYHQKIYIKKVRNIKKILINPTYTQSKNNLVYTFRS